MEIEFKQTSNIFINSGIIGLYIYLNKQKKDETIDYKFHFKLEKDHLKVTSDNLFKLLEDVYYKMGKDYYDTATKDQIEENGNAYYDIKNEKFERFPKMNTLGLTQLITNNAQGITRYKENSLKKEELLKLNPELYKKFQSFFKENNLELLSKVYLNEPYTKITRLDTNEKYLSPGNKRCNLTGESYKELVDYTCSSPLLAGVDNFESFGKSKSRKISWQASYLSRFSPVITFYFYIQRLKDDKKIVCYFFQSDNLIHTYQLYKKYRVMFLDKLELIQNSYFCNFRLVRFDNQKKDSESVEKNTEFVLQSEILFMLLYTYYRNFFFENTLNKIEENNNDFEPVKRYDEVSILLTYFRADSFASTMRPNLFEQFNHYKFIINLFIHLEKEKGINSQKMWILLTSLKYKKEGENKYGSGKKLRNKILNNILNIKPIIEDIKYLYYNCFNDLIKKYIDHNVKTIVFYRDYNLIFNILLFYEKIIMFGGNENMNEDMQEKAVELGTYIAMSIINYDSPQKRMDKETNIKGSRKYIISLNKTRTLQQFLNEMVRIKIRFGNYVNEDLLKGINEDNWEYIKSFCIISALNKLNLELLPKKEDKGELK